MNIVALIAPVIIIAIFVLPFTVSLLRNRGLMGLAIIFVLTNYTLAVMALAAKTGLPYGRFFYDSALGYKLFGVVPWLVVITYPSLLMAIFWLASKFTFGAGRIVLATLFGTLAGLMLDPVMVKLELWQWESPGTFYGVPFISFAGWAVTSLVGATLLHMLWGKETPVTRGAAYSGLLFVLFWTGANVGVRQWVPAAIGGVVGGLMLMLAGIESWANRREVS